MQKLADEKPFIDKSWFEKKLRDAGKSQAGLARHMNLDPSALSRTLTGDRKMKIEEANSIARFLGAPVSEVLQHAGASIDLDGVPTHVVLAATINENGVVQRLKEPKPLPQSVIDRAQSAINIQEDSSSVIAAQVRALDGPLAMFDDAVVLFAHTDIIEPAARGALSICRSRDGEQFIAKIEWVRKTGEARILRAGSKPADIALDTASAVIAIIP